MFVRRRNLSLFISVVYLLIAASGAFSPPNRHGGRKTTASTTSSTPTIQSATAPTQISDNTAVLSRPKPLSTLIGVQFLLASFRGQTHAFLTDLMRQHGDCFMILDRYVVLNDKDAIRDVLETHNLEKTPEVKRGYRSIFYRRGGILAAPWTSWIQQRRMVTPALQQPKVIYQQVLPNFVRGTEPIFDLMERVADKHVVVEMDQVFTALTLDIIGLVLLQRTFGASHRLLQGKTSTAPFVNAMNVLTQEAIRQMTLPSKLLQVLQPSRQVEEAKVLVDNFLDECITDRIEQRRNGTNATQTDMMNILLDAEEEGAIRRDDTKGQLLTFIFAGHDTTAHTLTWLLYEVTVNDDDLQNALYNEAKAALPSRNDFVTTPDVLEQFPLLDRVWKEANRKHPAAANGTLRKVGNAPIVVGNGLELPEKTTVMIPPFSLHRNEAYWPNPEVFDPSRFTEEMEAERDPMTFQAFSGGPRNCIGSKLARAEALSVLAPLFRRYKVECIERGVPADFCSLTRRPRDGIRFCFTRRE